MGEHSEAPRASARLGGNTRFHAYASERTYTYSTYHVCYPRVTRYREHVAPHQAPVGSVRGRGARETDREGQQSRPRGETRFGLTRKIRQEWVATLRKREEESAGDSKRVAARRVAAEQEEAR